MRGLKVAILTAATAWAVPAMAGDDAFKQAVNYVFSGNVEGKTPQLVTSIVDENRCIISVETPRQLLALLFEGDQTGFDCSRREERQDIV